MYWRLVIIHFMFLLFHNVFSEQVVKKLVTKRSDIDLQTCLDNFDVHKDKIIRTQDSKDMGAKYINEIDLGSREECSRLCCETENCDVFVYEDKNAGSCYLFQCGPPEDFKCKFTHHSNYSSAILAINRHLPDLESQIKLTKHEQELAKLSYRKPETEVPVNKPEVQSTTITTTSIKSEIQPTLTTNPPTAASKCSRYQFQCRVTLECIAIYNACDGIPQCIDASDEAQELGCPESSTARAAPPHQNAVYDDVPLLQNRLVNPQFPNAENQKVYQATLQQREQPHVQNLNLQRPDSDFIRPDNRNGFVQPAPPVYNEPSGPIYAQNQPQVPVNWAPQHNQINQMPQQYPQYDDRNSHIFNHKENGLQVSEGQGIRYNKHKGAMQTLHRALGYSSAGQTPYGEGDNVPENLKYVNYINEIYRLQPQLHPRDQGKWLKNSQDDAIHRNPFMSPTNQNTKTNWVQNQPQGKHLIEDNDRNQNYKTSLHNEENGSSAKVLDTSDHEHEKMAHQLKHSKELMINGNTEKKIKISQVDKHIVQEGTQYAKGSHYKIEEVVELQDGIAQTPGGAILSLTLGLIITCVMALLIGCRLRMVRRRMRRGGKSYAHDADYLVNGMYL